MKILRIEFRNINSLRGNHVIDLQAEPLRSAALFSITGPTGSGKSSILDVISLAIYNRIPRLSGGISRKVIEETGSILTRNTADAYAEVEYSCNKGRFRSRWSIGTARTGKLKDWHMELANAEDGSLIDLKKSEVAGHNESLIGLSYDQFIRSILLAQGDFAKFLRSKKDERGKLLEQITGSSIYREIGRRAFEMHRDHGRELEELKVRLELITEKQLDADEFAGLLHSFADAERTLQKLETDRKALQAQLDVKATIAKLIAQRKEAGDRQMVTKDKIDSFEKEVGGKLESHRSLLPLQNNLIAWENAGKQLHNLEERKPGLKSELEESISNKDSLVLTIRKFVRESVPETGLMEGLERFEAKVTELETQLKESRQTFKAEFGHAAEKGSKLDFTIDPKDLEQTISNLMADRQTKVQQSVLLREKLGLGSGGNLEMLRKESVEERDAAVEYKSLLSSRETISENLKSFTDESRLVTETIERLGIEIPILRQKAETSGLKLELLRKEQQLAEVSRTLEEHRYALTSGEPCPLCGADHHPYAEGKASIPQVQKEELGLREKENVAANNALTKALTAHEAAVATLKNQAKREIDLGAKLAEKELELKGISDRLPEKWSALSADEILKRCREKTDSLANLIPLEEEIELSSELLPRLRHLTELREKGTELSQKLKEIYGGAGIRQDTNDLRRKWQEATQAITSAKQGLAQWETQQEEVSVQLKMVADELAEPLQKLGFEDEKAALAMLLPGTYYEDKMQRRSEMGSQLSAEQKELEMIDSQLTEEKSKETSEDLTLIEQKLHDTSVNLLGVKYKRDELFSTKKFQEDLISESATLEKKIAGQRQKNEKWLLLSKYIGDAEGKRFSTFAQELTLRQLVGLANTRLDTLSDRYLLDLPADGEDESMAIIDRDMGGMRRSVRTLSGGESFLISLSLAIALSDLASRNVEIKSLFIDEGFGTLDPITLDQTLDTLEKLQAEGDKTIGIISHIDALKERISTQIAVVPNGQGFSRLEILPKMP